MTGLRPQLEDLPRLVDEVESGLYALRVRLAGGLGRAVRQVLVWPSLGLIVASPFGRAALLAALGAYVSADLLARAVALPRALRGASTAS